MPRWASGPTGQPRYWSRAKRELTAADQVMGGVIKACGRGGLTGHGDPFVTLVRAIVAQQISVRAADTIWGRLEEAAGGIAPDRILATSPETLRSAGLTRQKTQYVSDLAAHFDDGRLQPAQWLEEDDETVIASLVDVRGIGRWTAEMFLIFHLLRPDVLPLADIGLRRAAGEHYGDGGHMAPEDIEQLAENWRPWRSVATWYLWRSLDPTAVAY